MEKLTTSFYLLIHLFLRFNACFFSSSVHPGRSLLLHLFSSTKVRHPLHQDASLATLAEGSVLIEQLQIHFGNFTTKKRSRLAEKKSQVWSQYFSLFYSKWEKRVEDEGDEAVNWTLKRHKSSCVGLDQKNADRKLNLGLVEEGRDGDEAGKV